MLEPLLLDFAKSGADSTEGLERDFGQNIVEMK